MATVNAQSYYKNNGNGGGGGAQETRFYAPVYGITSIEDFQPLVDLAKYFPNVLIEAYSNTEGQDDQLFGYYTNIQNIKSNIRLYFEAVGSPLEPAFDEIIETIQLDSTVLVEDEDAANFFSVLSIGFMQGAAPFKFGLLTFENGDPAVLRGTPIFEAAPIMYAASSPTIYYYAEPGE